MVLKLYGASGSTCSKRVATILREKEVPYELVGINFAQGEQKTPEYLEKQPFGQVPYIVCLFDAFRCFGSHTCNQDDDGFLLFESRAICRYIEAKYPKQGTSLIPTDPAINSGNILHWSFVCLCACISIEHWYIHSMGRLARYATVLMALHYRYSPLPLTFFH